MDKKTLAIISYVTIVGWLVAYFQYRNKPKDHFVSYHLKQSLGIAIIGILFSAVLGVVVRLVPALSVLSYVNIAILVLWIIGILNAAREQTRPVPVVGPMFENRFVFLN